MRVMADEYLLLDVYISKPIGKGSGKLNAITSNKYTVFTGIAKPIGLHVDFKLPSST